MCRFTLRISYTEAIDILNCSSQTFTFPTEVSGVICRILYFKGAFWALPLMSHTCFFSLLWAKEQFEVNDYGCLSPFPSGVVTCRQNMRSTWWNIVATSPSLSPITPMISSRSTPETTRIIRDTLWGSCSTNTLNLSLSSTNPAANTECTKVHAQICLSRTIFFYCHSSSCFIDDSSDIFKGLVSY